MTEQQPFVSRQPIATAQMLLEAKGITRVFKTGAGEVTALNNVSVELAPGEILVVRGPSGSGKTTLLNILGSLDKPNSGEVRLNGVVYSTLKDDTLAKLRADN